MVGVIPIAVLSNPAGGTMYSAAQDEIMSKSLGEAFTIQDGHILFGTVQNLLAQPLPVPLPVTFEPPAAVKSLTQVYIPDPRQGPDDDSLPLLLKNVCSSNLTKELGTSEMTGTSS